jgi:5-methylcytosine-specific restriction endonuclease McrA
MFIKIPKTKRVRLSPAKKLKLDKEVYERDDWKCQKCMSHTCLDRPHHILYKSRGGSDVIDNLITLCRNCHEEVHFKNIKISRNENSWQFFYPKERKIIKNYKLLDITL